MNTNFLPLLKTFTHNLGRWLARASDKTAIWVTQLSWWKFFWFGILLLIAAGIIDTTLFTSSSKSVAVKNTPDHIQIAKTLERDQAISIDDKGIRIGKAGSPTTISIGDSGVQIGVITKPSAPPTMSQKINSESAKINTQAATIDAESAKIDAEFAKIDAENSNTSDEVKTKIADAKEKIADAKKKISSAKNNISSIRDATAEAIDNADSEISTHIQSSNWFMNFVLLLLLALFGTKILMGGKKRAEAKAKVATANAEHANLQREVSEAKMQMMQAQVEPHFLFNTLASVSHLIETDPPRAAAMQNRLIQYLRAVLPQMRETATVTNLGREADISKAYLDLLKMRMEERLTIDFAVPEDLRSAAFPPMMLQSLVENSIKHGLECKPEGGTMRVFAEVSDNKLRVSVADNGMGFGVVPSNSTGLGLQSIRDRLKLLHGDIAQLIITPNSPSGVCACIEVPYQLAMAVNGKG